MFVYQLFIEGMVFMEKKQNGEKCTGTFTKRIGNTTYRANVHFAEDTTDTVEDKLLHLMGTVALTDEISSATDEAAQTAAKSGGTQETHPSAVSDWRNCGKGILNFSITFFCSKGKRLFDIQL